MQIRNDYNPQQGQAYTHSHTHHITECFHKEAEKKKQGSIAGKATSYQKGDAAKAAVEYVASFSMEEMSVNKSKEKPGMIKGFWEALGEEGEGKSSFDIRQIALNGVHGAAAAIQSFWNKNIVKRTVILKEKVKAIPSLATKKFGKGKEAFGALLSGGMTFAEGKSKGKQQKEKEEVQMKQTQNHHLMDSYNKSGNYCQLNENLTYQKPKGKGTTEDNVL